MKCTASHLNLAQLGHKNLISSCFKCNFVAFFQLKDVLTQAQVIKVFYKDKIQTINVLQCFLSGNNLICTRNSTPTWHNWHTEIAEDILIISVITLTPLFSRRKSTKFTDGNQITIDILSSVLCQIKVCAKIRSQAVKKLKL